MITFNNPIIQSQQTQISPRYFYKVKNKQNQISCTFGAARKLNINSQKSDKNNASFPSKTKPSFLQKSKSFIISLFTPSPTEDDFEKTDNGKIIFKTNNAIKIQKGLVSLGYEKHIRDDDFGLMFPENITDAQLETLNKLINAKDNEGNPLYSEIGELIPVIKMTNIKAIDIALKRGEQVPLVGNLELYAKYASLKDEGSDSYLYAIWRQPSVALKVEKGNEELFEALIEKQKITDNIYNLEISDLVRTQKLPIASLMKLVETIKDNKSASVFWRISSYLEKPQDIDNETFDSLCKDFDYNSFMIERALYYKDEPENVNLIKQIYKISPELSDIISDVISFKNRILHFGSKRDLYWDRLELNTYIKNISKYIDKYPELISLLGCNPKEPESMIADSYVRSLEKQVAKYSYYQLKLKLAKCLQKHSLKSFKDSTIDFVLDDLSKTVEKAELGKIDLFDLMRIQRILDDVEEEAQIKIAKMPEFKSVDNFGGFRPWLRNYTRNVIKNGKDSELRELCDKLPEGYFEEPEIFISILKLKELLKHDLNSYSSKKLKGLAGDIQRGLYSFDFEKYPEFKEFVAIKRVFELGGFESYIASKQARFLNAMTPITPKLEPGKTKAQVYQAMYKEFLPEKLAKSIAQVDFESATFKAGVPLSYSRKNFISDVEALISTLHESDIQTIAKHFGVEFDIEKGINGQNKIVGFSNFPRPNYEPLPETLSTDAKEVMQSLNQIMEKFVYDNKVILPKHPETEQFLNAIIRALPEFVTIIGKPQHGTHAHTLDIHSLKVLQECINNPEYKNLSTKNKMVLNFVALLHDFGKKERVVDTGHEVLSSLYVRNILEKLQFTPLMNERIFNLVENHNWLTLVSNRINQELCKDEEAIVKLIAATFRGADEFKMAKIFAESDLKGVNKHFAQSYLSKLSDENNFIKEIEEIIENIQKTAILLNISKLNKRIKTEKIDGVEVIDLVGNPNEALKCFYGIKSIDDLRLLVHMFDSVNNLETLKILCTNGNNGNLSTSLTTNKKRKNYCERKFGIFLDVAPENVIQATNQNINSGTEKDKEYLISHLGNNMNIADARSFIPNSIKEELNISDEEYRQLFKRWSENKVSAHEFKAIQNATDRLSDVYLSNNEIVVFNPRMKGLIAKVDSIFDVPAEIKDFARVNKLPILIFGSKPISANSV